MPQPSAGTTSSTTSSLDILTDFRCASILDKRGQNTVTVGLAYVIILMPGNDIIYLFAFQKVWNNLEDALATKIFCHLCLHCLCLPAACRDVFLQHAHAHHPVLPSCASRLLLHRDQGGCPGDPHETSTRPLCYRVRLRGQPR